MNVNYNKIRTCPVCGGQEMIECTLDTGGPIYLTPGGFRNDTMVAVICRCCGNVLSTYCKTPQEFYPTPPTKPKKPTKPRRRRHRYDYY